MNFPTFNQNRAKAVHYISSHEVIQKEGEGCIVYNFPDAAKINIADREFCEIKTLERLEHINSSDFVFNKLIYQEISCLSILHRTCLTSLRDLRKGCIERLLIDIRLQQQCCEDMESQYQEALKNFDIKIKQLKSLIRNSFRQVQAEAEKESLKNDAFSISAHFQISNVKGRDSLDYQVLLRRFCLEQMRKS